MAKEHWYFICGMLAILLPLLLLVAVKKLSLLEVRPDRIISYKTDAKQALSLHAFMATDTHTPRPAILLFHGGRWLYGGPRSFYPQCQFFAAKGFHCFSAQYNLGANNRPEVLSAVADARAALDYLLDHADELGIDSAKIIVGGGSSGGHLAATLGVPLPHEPTNARRPAAMVLYNPMLDLAPGTPDHHLVKEYWQAVSPFHHIDASIPPSLLLLGSNDPEVPVPTAEAFCEAAQDAGGHCELAIYAGQGHGFYNNERYRQETNQRILAFIKKLPGAI